MSERITGIPAASGIAIGKALLFGQEEVNIVKKDITERQVPVEISRFEESLIQTRKEIVDLQRHIAGEMGAEHAEIFDAHLLVLEDRMLIEEVISRIKKERTCVEYIFSEVLKKYIAVFSKIEDEYLKERISDINDVGKRILRNLLGKKKAAFEGLKEKMIVVAHDLAPSDTATMHKKNVVGFITDIGGKTSHTAIMAKSLEIPAVVGSEFATAKIKSGDMLILDGATGIVIINPDKAVLDNYKRAREKFQILGKKYLNLKDLPAQTLDGRRVEIAANIELPEEIGSVIQHGAEGIGLYRTEFFYMNRKDLPSEEEHFQAYKFVARSLAGQPVIVRTLDLGGDKFISSLKVPHDMLPYLGWRAIRFCLARPDIFKVQLRAILRASAFGKLKIMYPMISGIDELRQANAMLDEIKKDLDKKGIAYNKDMQIGAMIEVPSAAMTADLLAKEVDFFSIGTNDLIQYSLAVDRANEKVAYLYEPAHPAVLRLIRNIINAGHNAGIWVGMCGEMSGDPTFSLVLLGLGLDEFSMPSQVIPQVKQIIRSVTMEQVKAVAHQVLGLSTGKEVEEFCRRKLKELTGFDDKSK